MLSADQLALRREALGGSADLAALVERLAQRVEPVLRRPAEPPTLKAQLTADGGICPTDGSPLLFDPWRPHSHRCPSCGKEYAGERHDGAWSRWQRDAHGHGDAGGSSDGDIDRDP